MGGGGGSSGAVSFPDYMEDTHQDWLGYSSTGVDDSVVVDLIEAMDAALGVSGNPYEGVSLTDPSTDFGLINTRYGELETLIDSVDEHADFDTYVGNVVAQIDVAGVLNDIDISTIISTSRTDAGSGLTAAISAAVNAIESAIIQKAVSNFAKSTSVQKERVISRFSASLADINAINSSAFMFGLAIIEGQHLQDIDKFESDLTLQTYQQQVENYLSLFRSSLESRLRSEVANKQSREVLLREGVQIMVGLQKLKVEGTLKSTSLLAETKRLEIVGTQEYELNDLEIDAKYANWDLEVFLKGTQVLGGIGGGSFVPPQPSKVGSAIGGALGGAATGAAIGSVVPGLGTAVGAGIGAILGLGAALL